jgi:hypothetical protein
MEFQLSSDDRIVLSSLSEGKDVNRDDALRLLKQFQNYVDVLSQRIDLVKILTSDCVPHRYDSKNENIGTHND